MQSNPRFPNPGSPDVADVLALPEILDIRAARPLADQFLSLRGRDVTVSAASVQRVGGQCLQVLLAARATWASDGGRFRVTAASPAFTEGLALLGAAALVSPDGAQHDGAQHDDAQHDDAQRNDAQSDQE